MRKYFTAIILLAVFAGCQKKEVVVKPEIKDLTEAVYASGNVFPVHQYQVYANADGLIQKIYVEAGDSIAEGQALFKIESDLQDTRFKTSGEIYRTAQENFSSNSPVLTEARAQLENARIRLQNDSANYVRFKTLMENNAVSKADFEKTELSYFTARNEYTARKNHLEKLKRQLYIDLQNAENQYKLSRKENQNFAVQSIMNGIVFEIYKEPGEAVRRNEPVALIGNNQKLYLRLSVDELDVDKVKPGQEVIVKIDLFKNRIFKAKVTKIHPRMNVQDQSFRVDAEFTESFPRGYYGLTVEANIIIQKKEKVLTIRKNILAAADSVWIKTEKGEQKVKIMKGAEDFDYVEVLQGITQETELIKK
jgi:HlyD family secretion protein